MSHRSEEEDELDDLDDLLDDFADEILSQPPGTHVKTPDAVTENPAPGVVDSDPLRSTASGTGETTNNILSSAGLDELTSGLEDEFAEKLKLGMDDLLKDMDTDPATRAQFEQLLYGMGQATDATPTLPTKNETPKAAKKSTKKPANFQDTINKTIERLKESGQEIDQEMANEDGEADDFLSEMLKQLGSAAGQAGDNSDDGFDMSNLVAEMMEQLSSKEVLYEPMLDMHEKYPAWLLKNASKLTPEELKVYKEQQQITAEIVQRFQSPRYSDSNKEDKAFIAERMERMQATGSPPAELMGDLAEGGIPGLDTGEDGLPKLPEDLEGCPTQ